MSYLSLHYLFFLTFNMLYKGKLESTFIQADTGLLPSLKFSLFFFGMLRQHLTPG